MAYTLNLMVMKWWWGGRGQRWRWPQRGTRRTCWRWRGRRTPRWRWIWWWPCAGGTGSGVWGEIIEESSDQKHPILWLLGAEYAFTFYRIRNIKINADDLWKLIIKILGDKIWTHTNILTNYPIKHKHRKGFNTRWAMTKKHWPKQKRKSKKDQAFFQILI